MTPSNTFFVEHFTRAARVAEARPDGTYPVKDLMRIAAEAGGIPTSHLSAEWRDDKRTKPRQVFYWLARRFTSQSFPQIGRRVCRDHSSVMAGVRHVNGVVAALAIRVDEDVPEAWAEAVLAVEWPSRRGNSSLMRLHEEAILVAVETKNGGSTPELHAVLKQIMPALNMSTLRDKLNSLKRRGLLTKTGGVPYANHWYLSARATGASSFAREQTRNMSVECPP